MSEHYRDEGPVMGYFCHKCGGVCNMYASGHFVNDEWVCDPNPELVKHLEVLNGFTSPAIAQQASTKEERE